MEKLLRVSTVVILILATNNQLAHGSGFGIFTQGARELGMLDAVVAHTEGPASNFFNPALLADLPGTQIEFGTTLIKADREFTSTASGLTTDEDSSIFYPSTFYLSNQFNDSLTGGIGIFSPFGLGTDWPDEWEGKYLSTFSEMRSFTINPNLAWKVTDSFSIAAGIDFMWSDAELDRKINLELFDLRDGMQKFHGKGSTWGYTLGLAFKVNSKAALGITYKSILNLELDGDVSFAVPVGTPPLFNNSGAEVDVGLPSQVFLGFSYIFTEKLLLEAGARWEGWSRLETLVFTFDQPPITGGGSTAIEPKNWADTWTYMAGAKYRFSPDLDIFAGFLHGNNPAPDTTFEPSMPLADHDMISIGLSKAWSGKHSLAATYLYGWYDDRVKNNPVGEETGFPASGSYGQANHMLAVSFRTSF